MMPGEGERLGQVRLALLAGCGTTSVHLKHDHPAVAVRPELLQHFRARLAAPARDKVLIGQAGLSAISHVHMRQPGPKLSGHCQRVRNPSATLSAIT